MLGKNPSLAAQINQPGQLSNSQDGCQNNYQRYDDLLFIHGVNKIENFWMISSVQYYDFDRTTVDLYNHVFIKSLQKNFDISDASHRKMSVVK